MNKILLAILFVFIISSCSRPFISYSVVPELSTRSQQIITQNGDTLTPPFFRIPPDPRYTPEMIIKRLEGLVKVKLLVGTDGKIKRTIILDDFGSESKNAALSALQDCEFEPGMKNGKKVDYWVVVPIRFKLVDQSEQIR